MNAQTTTRKTVSAGDLQARDLILGGVGGQGANVELVNLRAHSFGGEVDHYHATIELADGSSHSVILGVDQMLEIERTETVVEQDATGAAFPPVVEAWELVVEEAIESEEQDAADGERLPSMVNVRRQLAQQVVGERTAKEVAVDLGLVFRNERDAARARTLEGVRDLETLINTVRRDKMHTPDTRARLVSQLLLIRDGLNGQ